MAEAQIHFYQDSNPLLGVRGPPYHPDSPSVMTGDLAQAEKNVEHIVEIVEQADGADGCRGLHRGECQHSSVENNELARHDLEQGERVGVPVALLILIALFGAIVAALLPIGLAVICILAASGS